MAGFRSLLSISISFIFAMSPVYSFAADAPAPKASDSAPITSKTTSEVARTKVSSGDFSAEAKKFRETSARFLAASKAAENAKAAVPSAIDIADADSAAAYYANLHGSCVKTQGTASWLCREETSPELQGTLNQVNTVASLISGVAITDACSNLAKMARIATGGLTAYTAACSSARAACEGACATVKNNLDRVKDLGAKIKPTCTPYMAVVKTDPGQIEMERTSVAACKTFVEAHAEYEAGLAGVIKDDSNIAETKSIALREKACTYEYTSMIASAGAGIMSLVNSFKQGKQCEEETSGETVAAVDTTAAEKCSLAENAALQECICLANPRTAGCGNSYSKLDSSGISELSANAGGIGDSSLAGGGPVNLGDGLSNEMTHAERNPSSSGGMPGAPVGGGGAGLGGSGGGSGGGAGAAGEAKAATADYETGFEGGGGGGRGGFGGGSSSDSNKYRSYLPGGEKDPAKLAGSQAWKNEVTGQAGKTNFEKISDRYRDNNSTLLNGK